MTDFKDVMTKRTNSELLEITTVIRKDYKLEAVIAAEAELMNRNLTVQQLADAQLYIDNKKREQEKKEENVKAIKNKIYERLEPFNPLIKKSIGDTIKIITIFLAAKYLYSRFNDWNVAVLMFQELENSDVSSVIYFAMLILPPFGLYGFWTIKKYGWIILTLISIINAIFLLSTIGIEIKWAMEPPIQVVENLLDQLLPGRSILLYVIQCAFLIVIIIFLNRPQITEKYMISKRIQFGVIGLSALTGLAGLAILL